MKEDFLHKRLSDREEEGLTRSLVPENGLVDFSSNDYLGFARSGELKAETGGSGSGGSRLLTGNSRYAEELEQRIAGFHKAEAGLIFNSGYAANTGLLSCIAHKGDVIIYDERSHASIYDGVRLSRADSFPFRHNDVVHLEERLKFLHGTDDKKPEIFVAVESVYSMDGDFSPLTEIATLCEEYGAKLIVDEAHASGLFGNRGEGKVAELGLERIVFARVHTFGKALGCHGAIVLGSSALRDYLINFSRQFIYTTALPSQALGALSKAYDLIINSNDKLMKINKLIYLFKQKLEAHNFSNFLISSSPIQSFIVPGNDSARNTAALVQKDGFDVRPVLSPTVPKGTERIRICLHAFNTEKEMDDLLTSLKKHTAGLPEIILASS